MSTVTDANAAMRQQVTHLERRFGRRRVYIVGAALGLLALLFTWRTCANRQKLPPPPPTRNVVVTKVITRDVPVYLDEIGTCAAVESVKIQAQVGGQILSRDFQDGADVKKGDLLFRIDPRPYQAVLASAQADLALAQANLQRQTELKAKNVTATQDMDTARANAQRAEAAVAAAQVNLDYCTIHSPIDGRAGLRTVDVGNVVSGGNSGGTVLLSVDRFDQIYTDFTVAENDVAFVRRYLGNPNVKVQTDSPADDQPPRTGDLYFIDNVVQPGSGTVKARGLTPNPDRKLWPGQFVRVRFVLDQIQEARLVPAQAVQISQRGPFVFVLKQDNTVDQRSIKPGQRQDGDMTVIEDGLQPGETVVVTGQLALAPGTKVNPQPMDAPSGSDDKSRPPAR